MRSRWADRVRGPAGFLFAALLISARVFAETIPLRGVVDSRIRTAVYDSDQVYRIQGYVGFEVDLQFEPGESFVGIGSGDIRGLSFVSQDNHLFIKPKAANVSTNLTVLTSRRAYQLLYSVSSLKPQEQDADVIFAVRFTYPPSHADVVAEGVTRMLERSGSERPRNLNYGYCGHPSVKPIAASDDGVHTRLRFAAKAEQPAIFVLNDDGSESLLNFNMEGSDVVIHRVVRQLIVRRGRLIGRVVNKSFSGTGARLDSGTVSSDVERLGGAQRP